MKKQRTRIKPGILVRGALLGVAFYLITTLVGAIILGPEVKMKAKGAAEIVNASKTAFGSIFQFVGLAGGAGLFFASCLVFLRQVFGRA